MNEKQKNVLKMIAAVVVLMLVFPPFQSIGYRYEVVNRGYDLIFDPPLGLCPYRRRCSLFCL